MFSELVVKKKWKGLRDYFFRKNSDDFKTNDNDLNLKYCLWPLFDRLTFLLENKRDNTNFNNYKMTAEELELLEEVSQHEKRQKSDIETIIFHVPSSPPADLIPENSTPTPVTLFENEPKQKTTDQSRQCQELPLKIIKPTSNTLAEKRITQPGTTNKVTLCDPPPLRVFRKSPLIPKKTDSPLTKISTEQSQPPPSKKFKPTPRNDPTESETTSDSESDAELYFFKSLLPFMRALPLENRLLVRNRMQLLILEELEAVRNRDNCIGMTSGATTATLSVCEDRLNPLNDEDAGFDQQPPPNRPPIVKEELVKEEFEDEQTLLLEVGSKKIIFEDDDNYCVD